MKSLALDVDSVLAETMRPWVNWYNKLYPRRKQMTHSDLSNYYLTDLTGLPITEVMKLFSISWQNWKEMPPTEDALNYKTEKLTTRYSIDIVTVRTMDTVGDVINWLDLWEIRYRNFIALRRNDDMDGKAILPYDVYIDDNPFLAESILPLKNKFLWLKDQPWNQQVKEADNIKRYTDLGEILEAEGLN